VEQITVRGVNLDYIEAGFEGATGGLGEGVDDGGDAGLIECLGQCVAGREGQALGATTCQPPSAAESGPAPEKGIFVLALRPAWAS